MFRYSLSWYIFALALLESIAKTHLTEHDSSHGFISNNPGYLEDEFTLQEKITSGFGSGRIGDTLDFINVKFDPQTLDFMQRPLGVPHLKKVTLYNNDKNRSIDMTSISGSTVHFHSSFFEDKKVPPLGNTSFNVVFLGREEGYMESSLFIHTTDGHFKYDVKAISVYSPYRLRPIVGIKLPLNATFSPLIYLHNPHDEPIQIMEVYTSGGDFHLELPTGGREGPKDMWEIQPYDTKAVIRVRFVAKNAQNHTAYVRIKLNNTEEILVVPLEVEVTPNGGLFDPQGSIDFGVGGSLFPPKQVKLCLANPFSRPIRIHSVFSESEAIDVQYDNVKVQPSFKTLNKCTEVGNLTLNWRRSFEEKNFSGKIIVKYRNGKSELKIPYYLTILEGGLTYDLHLTRYFTNDKLKKLTLRSFKIKNNFLFALKILNISLKQDIQEYFTITNFKPTTIQGKDEKHIFSLKLKDGVQISNMEVDSFLVLHTNVSDIQIPILSYNGNLTLHLPFQNKDYSLNLGLISMESKKEVYFMVYNSNPVDINIIDLKSSIPLTSAEILGCGSEDPQNALFQLSYVKLNKCNTLKPEEYAIIKLLVQTSNNEGQIWGEIQIISQYEQLSVPVQFKVASGKLEIGPDRLVFDQCFPGKLCSHPLRVHSTFNEPMVIEDIVSLPPDARITSKHGGHILAHTSKIIGHLFLNPNLLCKQECYCGLQHDSSAQWLSTMNLGDGTSNVDANLVNLFYSRYLNLTSNGLKKWQNLTLRLDTSEVRGHVFKTRVKMSWPTLVGDATENKSLFTFNLTQIGNTTYKNITIRNPSNYNLVVQLVFDKDYPGFRDLVKSLPEQLLPRLNQGVATNHNFVFKESWKSIYDNFLVDNVNVSTSSLPFLLLPGETRNVTVGFVSNSTKEHMAWVFLRNNLTIVEVLEFTAQGAYPLFKLGNRSPGATQPIMFELTDKHMKECDKDRSKAHYPNPNLTVRRSFSARNTGDITIYVNSILINDQPCEGYGFKVYNCEAFVLPPNSSRKIEIAFTPDLTLTKVVRLLVLETSLNVPVNYTIHSNVPYYYLSYCAHLIARPTWEWYLRYAVVYLMIATLIIISIVAMLDAEKIKRQTLADMMAINNPASLQPVLDLRLVGQQTKNEIRSTCNKAEENKVLKTVVEKKAIKPPLRNPTTDFISSLANGVAKTASAVVPAISKGKKKISKRNSNEIVKDLELQKKVPEISNTKQKPQKPDTKAQEDVKKAFTPPLKKTVTKTKSNKSTTEEVPVVDLLQDQKENEKLAAHNHITKKICSRKSSNKLEDEAEIQKDEKPRECNGHKLERKKSFPKNTLKPSRENINTYKEEIFKHNHENKRTSKPKRERQANKRNFGNEKKAADPINPVRVSPSAIPNLWTENKAKFSEIVARNDPSISNSIVQPTPIGTPSHKSKTHDANSLNGLGPIGTRRDCWSDFNAPLSNGREDFAFNNPNSFFSNAQDVDFAQSLLSERWCPQQSSVLRNLEQQNGNISAPVQESWSPMANINSYWGGSLNSFSERPQQPQTSNNSRNNYLWGSSSVWEPLNPAVATPRTPTRTPPGFDPLIQQTSVEPSGFYNQIAPTDVQTEEVLSEEVYNAFALGDMWSQQNIWNYQPDPSS